MTKDEVLNKRKLLDSHRQRLAQLEIQRAIKGINVDPSTVTEIESITREIAELENLFKGTEQLTVSLLPLSLEKYDTLIRHIARSLPSSEDNIERFRRSLLSCLGEALNANSVLIAKLSDVKWEVSYYYGPDHRNTEKALVADDELQSFLYRLQHHYINSTNPDSTRFPKVSIGKLPNTDGFLIASPLGSTIAPEILVILGAKSDLGFDSAFGAILETILIETDNISTARNSRYLQISILNALKRNFAYVSKYMYEQQFNLFKEELKNIVFFYEPITSLSYYPYICRWEALARNKNTQRVPVELFDIAELWGNEFQIEIDIYCLDMAVRSYRNLPKREKEPDGDKNRSSQSGVAKKKPDGLKMPYQSRVGDLLPLSVNVYPATLIRSAYRNTILRLAKEKLIPLDKLTLELSEKRPLPLPEGITDDQDAIGWFRDRLLYYTKLGITFAIDDYGVGFASASRLSRLEPAIVKIDRDALLHS